MADFYFSEGGDIKLSPSGDIALTDTDWRENAQQAYVRIKTEPGDFLLYPKLGAGLSQLYGLPQTRGTADFGKTLILAALNREGAFAGRAISIEAAPTGPQSIRFDVYVTSGKTKNDLVLSIEQTLGVA